MFVLLCLLTSLLRSHLRSLCLIITIGKIRGGGAIRVTLPLVFFYPIPQNFLASHVCMRITRHIKDIKAEVKEIYN